MPSAGAAAQGDGKIDTDNKNGQAAGEQGKLLEGKETILQIGDKKEKATMFNDHHWSKIRDEDEITNEDLQKFSFAKMGEGGGKGGNKMAFASGYIVKELGDGDHNSLLKRTKPLAEKMLSKDTLLSRFYAHFKIRGEYYVVMKNCLPAIKKWAYLFDLKGCRDDKAMCMEGEKVPAVHKRCFSCLVCWYCCDMQCCPCYPDDRRRYYNGKTLAFELDIPFTPDQAQQIKRLIKQDSEFLRGIETMDYSLLLAWVEEDEKLVKEGQMSEEFKKALDLSKFVSVKGGKVRAYFMGVIDFLQEWNIKKDIANCIKACAPKPLSTIPPPRYADQFRDNLNERINGDAEEFKLEPDNKAEAGGDGGDGDDGKEKDMPAPEGEAIEMDAIEVKLEDKTESEPLVPIKPQPDEDNKARSEQPQPKEVENQTETEPLVPNTAEPEKEEPEKEEPEKAEPEKVEPEKAEAETAEPETAEPEKEEEQEEEREETKEKKEEKKEEKEDKTETETEPLAPVAAVPGENKEEAEEKNGNEEEDNKNDDKEEEEKEKVVEKKEEEEEGAPTQTQTHTDTQGKVETDSVPPESVPN
uniref:PIPK domain-containing protein n=1 Tax=Lotharella globosa TaxID=91324 RepID=A0A7S3YT82_9EUKA